MHKARLILVLGWFLGGVTSLFAQGVGGNSGQRPSDATLAMPVVMGKVVDSASNKALNLVVVDLVKLDEKGAVEGGLTDTLGNFKLALKSGFGRYVLKLTALGYPVLEIADTLLLTPEKWRFDCGVIGMTRLEGEVEKMQGAEIRVSGPVIENKIDRLV
ncbi:MAG: hypothetical protein ACKOXR_00980, partial [Bacteroidota bacterium]